MSTTQPLVMTNELINVFVTAGSVSLHQIGGDNKLTVYKDANNYNAYSTLYLPGSVYGNRQDMRFGKSFCSLTYNRDVFKLLKKGDRISVEWHPDNRCEFTIKLGLVVQECYIVIERPKMVKGREEFERIKILVESSVYDDSLKSIWMCQGYEIKRTSIYDEAA